TGGTGTGTGTGAGTGAGTAGASSGSSAVQTQLTGLYDVLEDLPEAVGVNGNGIGSNSWVVAGSHTITGKPL
ncbi:hypothetical protein CTU88_46695, partial [Streptomyces sp. JV178]